MTTDTQTATHTPGLVFQRVTKTNLGDWSATVTEPDAPSGHRIPAIVYGRTLEEATARAALFASAPALLAACEALLSQIESLRHHYRESGAARQFPEQDRLASDAAAKARAAIARAKGGAA